MKCAIYVRVSTDMDAQKSSIAHQRKFFEEYTKSKGWQIYKIYEDIESGRNIKNRRGLKELIKDSENEKFNIVLTKSISRFARNTLEGLHMIREFKDQHIRFITIEDGFDSEEYDEFMFTLLLSIAQKESEKMSERIRFGKMCRAKNGNYNGSIVPFGYKKIDKNKIVPAQDSSTYIVKKIFSMYLEGNGIYKIAKELNEKAYPTPSQIAGKKNSTSIWYQSSIRKIISNSFYIGNLVQNKTKTENALTGKRKKTNIDEYIYVYNNHEGIIEPIVFKEVQRKLKEKQVKKIKGKNSLFSNVLFCGKCGSKLYYKKNKNAYVCGKSNKMGKKYCTGVYVNEKLLEMYIAKDLKEVVHQSISIEKIEKSIKENHKEKNKKTKLEEINKDMAGLEEKKRRLLDFVLNNWIDDNTYVRKKKEIKSQSQLLIKERDQLIKSDHEKQKILKTTLQDLLLFKELKHMSVHKLIERICIWDDWKIHIEYGFFIEDK
ncbi:recombinase family protein [Lutibacter sp. B2]|nr:recombinase family protein [Lutibacter sp. B2]